jgi:hypothetical protein
MKTYLSFSIEGEIKEYKTDKKKITPDTYSKYNFMDKIKYKKYNFIILYNNNDTTKNITVLPFFNNKDIYGEFLLFQIDDENNLKSLTENKILKLFNKSKITNIEDYSSDDFNLSE